MQSKIQKKVDELANLCLEEHQIHHGYKDQDLFNASLVFIHFFADKMYSHHVDKITNKQMEKLAEEAGKSIRKTIKLFCGVDMHEVAKQTKAKS